MEWISTYSIFCFLDNNQYEVAPHTYECLVGIGASDAVTADDPDGLAAFLQCNTDKWKFGHLSYDLKNSIYPSLHKKEGNIGFPPLFFFIPQIVLALKGNSLSVTAACPDEMYKEIQAYKPGLVSAANPVALQSELTKEAYLHTIAQLQAHIRRGDCYEINFCMESFAENTAINPVSTFWQLSQNSPAPFSAFYRLYDSYVLCASPERYVTKRDTLLTSQPIKGTAKRAPADAATDEACKLALYNSAKDRAENVMIVDLVRNDLARVCKAGSVTWNRLYEIQTYPQVHQMVSTISGTVGAGVGFPDIIKATFPMGSMTGAPKHRVLQLIDTYEQSGRGIFSGSVGYINPEGDFDFNVVIRSLMYNAANRYLSCRAGSAITTYSIAEQEWEECLLKMAAIRSLLAGA